MNISQRWTRDGFASLETLYHSANGYLGVRSSPEEGETPGSIRGAYINGFYEIEDIPYCEKLYGFPDTKQVLVNLPDAQTIRLIAQGQTLRVQVERMVSFQVKELFLLRLRVSSVDYNGELALCSVLNGDVNNHAAKDDPRVATNPLKCLDVLSMIHEGGV